MERVLVVLPNWFGETLFATPFLRALRGQRPDAYVATLGWPQCRDVLLHNPHVNELIDFDERGRHRNPFELLRLIRALRARRFTTTFILRRSLSRALLLTLAGIRDRIGFEHPKSNWLLTRRVPNPSPVTSLHKAFSYLSLLEERGFVPRYPYEYMVSEEERQAARKRLAAQHLWDGKPFVVLHPGANWPHKRWPTDCFAALGDRLIATRPVRVVVTGGPHDAHLARAISRAMRQPSVMLAGQTTIRELAACFERARLVVSNDTGILHIAAALRRPVVALYGPTSPTFTGPLGDPSRMVVLHHPDCCPQIPCYQPTWPPHAGMSSIAVDEAYGAACTMLALKPPAR